MKVFRFIMLALAIILAGAVVSQAASLEDTLDKVEKEIDEFLNDDSDVFVEPDDDADVDYILSDLMYIRYDLNAKKADDGYPKKVDANTWGLPISYVDAALNYGNKVYFFDSTSSSDIYYVRWDIKENGVDDGYPKTVNSKTWPGLNLDYITATLNWGNGKAYYMGYGDAPEQLYTRYDIKSDKQDAGYPSVLNSSNWDKLSLYDISAAIKLKSNNKAYLFGKYGTDGLMYYVRYDTKTNKMDKGYPKLVADEWKGLGDLDLITAAVDWGNGKAYFFGYQYIYTSNTP